MNEFDILNVLFDFRVLVGLLFSLTIAWGFAIFRKFLEAWFSLFYSFILSMCGLEYLNYLYEKPQAPQLPWVPKYEPTTLMVLLQKDYILFWLLIGLVCVGPTWYILIRIMKGVERKLLKGD